MNNITPFHGWDITFSNITGQLFNILGTKKQQKVARIGSDSYLEQQQLQTDRL